MQVVFTHVGGNEKLAIYSLSALSCRDNFPVCVYEPAHQRCEALRHYFISWSHDCHTFINPLRKRNIDTRVSVIVIVE